MTRLVLVLCAAFCAWPACAEDPAPPDELQRWVKLSADHGEIVSALRRLRPKPAEGELTLEAIQARRELERAALNALRGGADRERRVQALEEMLKQVKGRSERTWLAKALAGIEHPAAAAATKHAMSRERDDPALLTTLARHLPETEAALAVLVAVFEAEETSATLRATLLRELSRREPGSRDDYVALLARLVEAEPDPGVRGEAITLAGRLGDPRLKKPLAASCQREKHVQTRQRALVAYAQVAGAEAVPLLAEVAHGEAALPVQASAVLGLGRIGGDEARAALRGIALKHRAPEIKTRAQRLLDALEARD